MNASEFAKRRARIEHERRHSRGYVGRAMAALEREAKAVRVYSRGKLVAWYLPNGQTVCRKRRYRKEFDAMMALAAVHADPKTPKIPVRWYRCGFCHGYHLTSQPIAINDNEA